MVSLTTLKCVSAVLLLLVAGVGGLIPLCMKIKSASSGVTAACNAFAGGVLLAAALVHMLPDACEGLEAIGTAFQLELNPTGEEKAFPLAQTIAGTTFILFYLFEAAVSRRRLNCPSRRTRCEKKGISECSPRLTPEITGGQGCNTDGLSLDAPLLGAEAVKGHGCSTNGHAACVPHFGPEPTAGRNGSTNGHSHGAPVPGAEDTRGNGHSHGAPVLGAVAAPGESCNTEVGLVCCATESLQEVCTDSSYTFSAVTSPGFLAVGAFLLALAVHSLMEGVSMGVQASPAQFAAVLLAVLAHKGLAGFALGSQLVRYCSLAEVLFGVGAFSLCSPIGMLLGTFVSTVMGADAKAVVQAVSCGTFLYVAIPELLMPSFQASSHYEVNIMLAVVGFLSMSLLAAWA